MSVDSSLNYDQLHLIKMINQIASNVPNRNDVAGQIATHMRSFWTPVMQVDIQQIAREHPETLTADAHQALEQLRSN